MAAVAATGPSARVARAWAVLDGVLDPESNVLFGGGVRGRIPTAS